MDLRGRLKKLRRQIGAVDPAELERSPLADRVRRLRVGKGEDAAGRPTSRPRDEAALAKELGGRLLSPGLIHLRRVLSPADLHGRFSLFPPPLLPPSPLISQGPWESRQMAFLDTETSGLSGGVGTTVFMAGVGRIHEGRWLLDQFLLSAFAGEEALWSHFLQALEGTGLLVSFNGRSFDVPLIEARLRLSGRREWLSHLPHLDLLHPVRRLFGGVWPDCRLATVEDRLLGVVRENDLPGALAPLAWSDWLRTGNGGRLGDVAAHNALDLMSLAALTTVAPLVFRDPERFGADPVKAAESWRRCGEAGVAQELLERSEPRLGAPGLMLLARDRARRGEWPGARAIWERLASRGSCEAMLALAKHHEHVSRDLDSAEQWTRRLLAVEPDDADFRHRARRIARKRLARTEGNARKRSGERATVGEAISSP